MDYDVHLNSRQLISLWDEGDEERIPPLFEDPAEIDRMIEEEIGKPKRRRRPAKQGGW